MPNLKTIGQRLKELRKGESQESVACEIGISKSALSMYERGERMPRDEVKVRISHYYGKTVQEIFFDDEKHI